MSFVLTLPLMLLMILGMWFKIDGVMRALHHPVPHWRGVDYWAVIQFLLATPVVAVCGQSFYKEAWSALKHCATNMQVLLSGICGGFPPVRDRKPSRMTGQG